MKEPSAILDASRVEPTSKRRAGIYESIVLRALEEMTAGCLHLELPDRSKKIIGHPGARITANIRVVNERFFKRCVLFGDVGFGEAYVEGDWETDDITKVIS